MATVTSFPDDASAILVPPKPAARSELGDLERILPIGRQRRRLIPGGVIGKGLGPLALVAVWSIGTSYGWISPDLLPGPRTLWATLLDLIAYSDDAGHPFRHEAGHPFRIHSGHDSGVKPAISS